MFDYLLGQRAIFRLIMSRHDLTQMNESERQFFFIQELKKLEFFNINDFVSFEETNLKNLQSGFGSDESEKSVVLDDKIQFNKEPSNSKFSVKNQYPKILIKNFF